MQHQMKALPTELLWLTFSLMLTSLASPFIFGLNIFSGQFFLHLHDTYFIISKWLILLPLFCFFTFFIYFFKENRKGFTRKLPGYFFIISGLALAITLTILIKQFSQYANAFTSGSTNSGLTATENPLVKLIANFLTVLQLAILFLLFYGTYRLGQKNK